MSSDESEMEDRVPDVFVTFYEEHYSLLLTVAQQRLGGLADAEDATAEVFRIAWRHYRDTGELTLPWAYQTLRNVIGNEYRRRGRASNLTDDLSDISRAVDDPRASDDRVAVRSALSTLSESDRDLLFMAYWEDLTHREIGQILGCTTTAVKVRLFRARARLHDHLTARVITLEGRPQR